MIYPSNFEQKTGFDKVRKLVTEKCLSPLGEERVADMDFSADYNIITERLEQVHEFARLLEEAEEFPSNYFLDVRYSLKRIKPEGTWMDEKELFDLKRSLQTIQDIVRFLRPGEEEEVPYPALTKLAGDIQVFPKLIGQIDTILDKFGETLKIRPGQTTEDGLFSLDDLRCLGACGIAPAVSINGHVYPKVTLAQVPKIIEEYRAKSKEDC